LAIDFCILSRLRDGTPKSSRLAPAPQANTLKQSDFSAPLDREADCEPWEVVSMSKLEKIVATVDELVAATGEKARTTSWFTAI
jgi:hypothetical protein